MLSIIGLVMLAIGTLWALQGIGLVGGSFMTGSRQWLWIGIGTGIVGMLLLVFAKTRRL